MTHDVFICHSSEDRTLANAICSHLEQNRIRCWIAPRDVVPGSDYAQSIVEAIAGTAITVLVFSHSSNHSPHVKREIERSVSHGIPILPFRVEDVVPSPSLEYFISDAHWLDAITPPMEEHLNYLAGTVRMLLDRESAAAAAAATAAGGDAATVTPPIAPVVPTPPVAPSPASRPPAVPTAPRSRPRWLVPAAIAGVVIVVVAGVVIALGGGDDGGAPAAPPTSVPTVAPTTADSAALDESPNETTPPDEVVMEPERNFIDGFDGVLIEGWTWVNEDSDAWRVAGGWLEIDAAPSPPITNILLRALPDDHSTLSTYVQFRPTANYQFAGIVLTGDDPENERLQFGRAFCDQEWCVGDGLYLDVFEGGELVSSGEGMALEDVDGIFLGLEVYENSVIATFSYDGEGEWDVAGVAPWDSSYTRIGLIAHQAPAPVTAAFDYVVLAGYQ